jgi:uncharacterized protein (DUF1697 family)
MSMVAFLRGINVGGAGKLPMADLREIVSGCGMEDVRTYIQSGNLVFRSPQPDTRSVETRLRKAIADATQLDPEVHVRTAGELASVVDANPFADRTADPKQLHVTFLTEDPAEITLAPEDFAPEAWEVGERVVYLYLPDGIGRSRLATQLGRGNGPTGTTRNWRTVTKLLEMTRDAPD